MRGSTRKVARSVLGTLVGVTVIFVILWIMLRAQPASAPLPVDPEALPPEEILAGMRAEETEKLTTYGWVDREKGIVRIPIEEAMRKLIEEAGR
ncbi:MAG: hypothetical protein ACYTGV_06350 [Planctomycetota bacterium]|jgi:hypothetical protein